MRKSFPSLFASVNWQNAIVTASSGQASAAEAVAQVGQLANGVTVLLHPMAGASRLSLSFYFQGGNLIDPLPGQMDIVERLLTKGTRSKDAEAIAVAIDDLALDLDVDTNRDYIVLSSAMLTQDLSRALPLFHELLFDSTLAEAEKELERYAGELAMDLDSPRSRASDLLIKSLFKNSGYGCSSSVVAAALPKIKTALPQLETLYKQTIQPQKAVIVASGDIALEALIEQLNPLFGQAGTTVLADSFDREARAAAVTALRLEQNTLLGYAWPDASQCHIFRSWFAPLIREADYIPMLVLNTLLGGAGLSARLFLELRDKQGLAYNVRSSLDASEFKSTFTLYIGTNPQNTAKCLEGFQTEIDKLINIPVAEQELSETKANLIGRRTVFLETPLQWTSFVGNNWMMGRTPAMLAELENQIQAVSAADIQRVAKQYLAQPSLVSIAGPADVLTDIGATLDNA